ncbi:thiol peroxidase [Deferribacter autotrophicus]|uniref:Thiol peroxidase n=1 Tax=Deferribacter autotrophicus TaxID=500465 RepID=A0A5A8F8N7_9BACT|nr:thiol peroxidase [Deferribacter autotrophicus]KAA0258792.1 thiol peroxidase [Deferribacter autotrophicus]
MTVTLKGNPVSLFGEMIQEGDNAPEVKLVNSDLAEITVGGSKDKVQLLISVPSLDTPVCATEARKFNEKVSSLNGVDPVIVSMDLPFAAKRFCTTEGLNITVASDFREKDFGKKYGVLITDGPLAGVLARVVFIVDKEGKVVYRQVVPEITTEPDYDDVLKALEKII